MSLNRLLSTLELCDFENVGPGIGEAAPKLHKPAIKLSKVGGKSLLGARPIELTFGENLIRICQTQYFTKQDQPCQQQLQKRDANVFVFTLICSEH